MFDVCECVKYSNIPVTINGTIFTHTPNIQNLRSIMCINKEI